MTCAFKRLNSRCAHLICQDGFPRVNEVRIKGHLHNLGTQASRGCVLQEFTLHILIQSCFARNMCALITTYVPRHYNPPQGIIPTAATSVKRVRASNEERNKLNMST